MSTIAFPTRRSTIAMKCAFLLLLLTASLAISQHAWAQATANFDLACRSLLTSAGGQQTALSGITGTQSSFAQWTQGISQSPNYQVRTGFIQPGLHASVADQPALTANLTAGAARFLPIIRNSPFVVRACQY